MKSSMVLFAFILIIFACNKTEQVELSDAVISSSNPQAATRSNQVSVCHNGNIINVNINAVPAHQGHGDAVDMDGDGYFDQVSECGSLVDCDDTNAAVNPGASEISGNGIDDDCNSNTPDQQGEICDNGIDDDGDGDIDINDRDCRNFNGGL